MALPGEIVSCQIVEEKRDWARAEILEIKKPSPIRIRPFCKYFGKCGGCQFQHLPYEKELSFKYSIFKKIIEKLKYPPEIEQIIGSFPHKGYRARARLFVNNNGFGFRKRGSKELVLIKRCPLFNKALNNGLNELWTHSDSLLKFHSSIKSVTISSGMDPEVKVFLEIKRDITQSKKERIKDVFLKTGFDIFFKTENTSNPERLVSFYKGEFAPKGLFCDGADFFQANTFQNENLITSVISFSKRLDGKTLMEFFCGSGNFSIPLALTGFKVIGLDISERGIENAKINAKINNIQEQSLFLKRNLDEIDLSKIKEKVDICLLDPPRTGAKKICKNIHQLNPSGIIYVSCDPMTLKRDLEYLIDQGYRPQKTVLIDLFPHTFHIESVTLLLKKG